MRSNRSLRIACFIALGLCSGGFARTGADRPKVHRPVQVWLRIGPVPVKLPVFHEDPGLNGKSWGPGQVLAFDALDTRDWLPEPGSQVPWNRGALVWRAVQTDTFGIRLLHSTGDNPDLAYLAFYMELKRFGEVELVFRSHHLLEVFVNGRSIGVKPSSDSFSGDGQPSRGRMVKTLNLETGKHLVLIKTLRDPDCPGGWSVGASAGFPQDWAGTDVNITMDSERPMSLSQLLESPQVVSVSVSARGDLAALTVTRNLPSSDQSETWLELVRVRDGERIHTFRGGMGISRVQWAPSGRRFTYTTQEEKSALWLVDLDAGTSVPLLEGVEDLDGHTWSPDGSFIVYSITEKPEDKKTGMKRLRGMPDRWPGFRNQSYLYRLDIPGGTRQRLTAGAMSTFLHGISPDGSRLIFSRSHQDYSERPYATSEFFMLDLNTMKTDTLWSSPWIRTVQWGPDGNRLLVTGGPESFDGIGRNLPEEMIPNDYDTQVFIVDLNTGTVDPITRDFEPSVNQAVWTRSDPFLYLSVTEGSYVNCYRYDPGGRVFEKMETGVDVLGELDLAELERTAVYIGSGTNRPARAYVMDLRRGRFRVLSDPGAASYRGVRFGRVEPFAFLNSRGVEIEGHVYYPADFDPGKKYPCIVYYYGGTTPVTRDFGGRYPKELYAAMGYVVYVLQPSGAVGFGQAFSALHVNDWGRLTSEEIVDGTRRFLAAHPFVDEKRVGCMGASYGGFMTLTLTTQTDIFRTAVSHAGISSLSSYWGEGYWGYLYSAIATANSFPWNRRDLYVDQSPLFNADKIRTPLLLLHGAVDTNVPPGESIQLYTALKLLGREVELIQVEGQNHHIMQTGKRMRWTQTILAWFDRWLKDQPEWWESLYGEE